MKVKGNHKIMKQLLFCLTFIWAVLCTFSLHGQSCSSAVQFDPGDTSFEDFFLNTANYTAGYIRNASGPIDINQLVRNGEVCSELAANVTFLNISGATLEEFTSDSSSPGLGITSLVGLEYFTGLEFLYAQNNPIPALDVSANTQLRDLRAFDNIGGPGLLSLIDLRGLLNLEVVGLNGNSIERLLLENNTSLRILSVANNQLTGSLDLRPFVGNLVQNAIPPPDLRSLDLRGNNLTCVTVNDLSDVQSDWRLDDVNIVNTNCTNGATAEDFVITIKTDNPGTSAPNEFAIPTLGGGYNYNVDWGDGQTDNGVNGDITHVYATSGTYTVRISDNVGNDTGFPRLHFNNVGDKDKLLSVDQWGRLQWTSMGSAFHGCSNMVMTATDIPDLSSVSSLNSMFEGCTLFNGDIGNWNVSNVTSSSAMFELSTSFNRDISSWNVVNITTMRDMFNRASSFNQNLGNWVLRDVTNITEMFDNSGMDTDSYDNTLIGWAGQAQTPNDLELGAVNLFYCNPAGRQSLMDNKNWTIDDAGQASNCSAPLTDIPDPEFERYLADNGYDNFAGIGQVLTADIANITDLDIVDYDISDFMGLQDFSALETFSLTDDLAGSINIIDFSGNPNLRVVSVFNNGAIPEAQLSGIDISSNSNLETISITSVSNDFNSITIGAKPNLTSLLLIGSGISGINLSQAPNINGLFLADNTQLTQLNVENLIDLEVLWTRGSGITELDLQNNLNLERIEANNSFNGALTSVNLRNGTNGIITSLLIDGNPNLNCIQVDDTTVGTTPAGWVFDAQTQLLANCTTNPATPDDFIITIRTDNPGTSNNDQFLLPLFAGETYDFSIDWDNDGIIDDASVTTQPPAHTYPGPGTYTIVIKDNVGDDTGFPRIHFNNVGDKDKLLSIDQWGMLQWTSMGSAFHGCSNMVMAATDTPDLSSVLSLNSMFEGCTTFNGDIGNWDVSNVTSSSAMFELSTSFNRDISGWDVSNITTMRDMFNSASSFNQNLGSWVLRDVTNITEMFDNSGMDTDSYDNTLIGWAGQAQTPNDLELGAMNLFYCNPAGRQSLEDDKNWTIMDAGQANNCNTCTGLNFVDTNLMEFLVDPASTGRILDSGGVPVAGLVVNGEVCQEAAADVFEINLDGGYNNTQINSLVGLEQFPNLAILNVSLAQIVGSVDLSPLINLQEFEATGNEITDLTASSANVALARIDVSFQDQGQLTAVNFNGNVPLLESLSVQSNANLTAIDLTSTPNLGTFRPDNTGIIFLDLSQIDDLDTFDTFYFTDEEGDGALEQINLTNTQGNFNVANFQLDATGHPNLNCVLVNQGVLDQALDNVTNSTWQFDNPDVVKTSCGLTGPFEVEVFIDVDDAQQDGSGEFTYFHNENSTDPIQVSFNLLGASVNDFPEYQVVLDTRVGSADELDFVDRNETISISTDDGGTDRLENIDLSSDNLLENQERFFIDITPVGNDIVLIDPTPGIGVVLSTGETLTFEVNIIDNETPEIRIVATDDTANEAGETSGTVEIEVYDANSGEVLTNQATDITIEYALAGNADLDEDYTVEPASPVTIGVGASVVPIVVTAIDDMVIDPEDDEVIVQLVSSSIGSIASGANGVSTINIIDNDESTNGVPNITTDTFQVTVTENSCIGSANGAIAVEVGNITDAFVAVFQGANINLNANSTENFEGLEPGLYDLTLLAQDFPGWSQVFRVTVGGVEPLDLQGFTVDEEADMAILRLLGSTQYMVSNNGKEYDFDGFQEDVPAFIRVPIEKGINNLTIQGEKACQGILNEQVYFGELFAYPVPARDILTLEGLPQQIPLELSLFDISGRLIHKETWQNAWPGRSLDLSRYVQGKYFLRIVGKGIKEDIQVLKR